MCANLGVINLLILIFELTGHFSIPNTPKWPGFDQFEGRILHSHDFRDAKEFSGKDILVIGTHYSAEDVGLQCYKYVFTYSIVKRLPYTILTVNPTKPCSTPVITTDISDN